MTIRIFRPKLATASADDGRAGGRDPRVLLVERCVSFDPGIQLWDVPCIYYVDISNGRFEEGMPRDFAGRIVLEGAGPKLNSSREGPFPKGPVRLSIVRWGRGADDVGRIEVGAGTELNGTSIVSYRSVRIGKNVLFGPEVVIMDADGHEERPPHAMSAAGSAPIAISDDAWIGFRATILKGVTIGEGAIVGAGAVVTHDVPPRVKVAGNPARKIGDVSHV